MRPKGMRGFSLAELLLCLVLILLAASVLYLSWQRSRKLASLTRARGVAILQCESLLEEIRAHRFGQEAPPQWDEPARPSAEVWVGGQRQSLSLRQKVTFKTGAFVGRTVPDMTRDEVTVTLDWQNPPGQISVTVPVWRP